jgi:Protein kinase domain
MRAVRAAAGALPFAEGRTVAGYSLGRVARRRLGEVVYDGQAPDGRPVSLVASAVARSDRDDRLRFRRLAGLRAAVEHAALLPVYDWGEHRKVQFLVTARYPRTTLVEALPAEGLPPEAALELLWPVAEGLDECHSEGLVHECLTAESVLTHEGHAVLDAFGIPTAGAQRDWEMRNPREFQYGTPEVVRGEPVTPAANVYSLTALLVHLLTGRPPYGDGAASPSNAAWTAAILHLTEPPPRPSERVRGLGSELDRVVAWGMHKQAAQRPPSATALLEAATYALGAPARAGAPRPVRPATVRAVPRRASMGQPRRAAALAAVATAAVCGVLAAALLDPFGGDPAPQRAAGVDVAAWEHLAERRAMLRADLAAGDTAVRQSSAARSLAAEYDRAADASPPGTLAAALRSAAGAYYALAEAGAGADEDAFAEAGEAVVAAERRVASAPR